MIHYNKFLCFILEEEKIEEKNIQKYEIVFC